MGDHIIGRIGRRISNSTRLGSILKEWTRPGDSKNKNIAQAPEDPLGYHSDQARGGRPPALLSRADQST